ncbi:N-acyl-D-amino-acid deacylase family protein [Sphingobium lignivorans]|uniref:N-acyl-D-aspartate/D-glutamate deacylase n=1 Tax=Sphingobium lignivorans TaxID=2735886 RepID=A0ABR6NFQ1_9SPHN|nr:amidohydrolase family protein [Sphingobium lignivorans]MBB5985462.1 N-acyl-D-aspartate/D-glutamate deacylase [Sphingobium lignivorans]
MAILSCSAISAGALAQDYDVLLRGGTIYTGSDAPFVGDVAIAGDKLVYVGPRASGKAKRVIDAKGMIVSPGFIDPHTHVGDMLAGDDAAERLVLPFLMQGVTTAFIGNDGAGDPDVASVLGRPRSHPVGINYATFVGLGAVRNKVIGPVDRAPSADELARMKTLVATAMCQGALGLSTGLFYAPQSFAKQDEVVALAREAAVRGGIYDSHIRDESSYTIGLSGAIEEALTIGREAGLPVHIAHIKALGVDVHGQAGAIIAKIEAAQAAGQVVHADQYPWSASGTGLSASLLPRWAEDGGRKAMLARFDDADTLERIKVEMRENMRRRGGADSLLITSGGPDISGKTLAQVGTDMGLDPVDAAVAILRKQSASVASFNQSEADIAAFMKRPWVMTSSDASTGHPRVYGSFARKYDKYVRQEQVVPLRDFIERSSRLTAEAFSLQGRGRLAAGSFADVLVFDPERYSARADYVQPTLFAKGVRFVFVNGGLAVEDGAPTGVSAGRALPRTATSHCP